jgi:hypothetical protein
MRRMERSREREGGNCIAGRRKEYNRNERRSRKNKREYKGQRNYGDK